MSVSASKPSSRVRALLRGSRLGRFVKRVIAIAAFLALIPVGLTLLYLPPFIHPISTLMLKDTVFLKGYHRQWVAISDINPVLVHSVMMSEDGQFCTHSGVDWAALNDVIDDAMDGEGTRGASTISMQTVKNLYLWNSRSFLRKGLELPYALMIDLIWSKRRLMEVYLNIAEWGPGIYGVEAAAQHHFGVSAKNLSRRQAALLAVSLPNPILRNPGKPSRGLNRLARVIERRAIQAGGYVECVTPRA
jgi:monofunctional glycosyltransferase